MLTHNTKLQELTMDLPGDRRGEPAGIWLHDAPRGCSINYQIINSSWGIYILIFGLHSFFSYIHNLVRHVDIIF